MHGTLKDPEKGGIGRALRNVGGQAAARRLGINPLKLRWVGNLVRDQ